MSVEVNNLSMWILSPTDHEVRIDRKSPYGNPFIIGRHGNRAEVIDQYQIYFDTALENPDSPLGWHYKNRLLPLYEKNEFVRLLCWCYPKRCHGDIIKAQLYKDTRGVYR